MLRILVVEGNTREKCEEARRFGLATQSELYAATLTELSSDVSCDVVHPADADGALPVGADIAQYHGIAWTGSALNIYHMTTPIRRQVDFAKACFERGREIFGSCWGLQVATVATGGEVSVNKNGREIGIARKIELTAAGVDHPLFAAKPRVFDSVGIHLDHITTLPAGTVVLARNDHSEVQAAEIRRGETTFWGVQYHPEFDLAYMAGLFRRYRTLMTDEGFVADDKSVDSLADDYATLSAEPGRGDLRWRLGVDDDVLDPACRLLELRNWIDRVAARGEKVT